MSLIKIKMKDYGLILTGREYGINVAKKITISDSEFYEFELDFNKVVSMGSSFGDEILKKLQSNNECTIKIKGANKVIKQALFQIASDLKIELNFHDDD